MNDHVFVGSRDFPLPRMMRGVGVVTTVCLLLMLTIFLAGRRMGGAFHHPLHPATLLLLGIGCAALAAGLRMTWPHTANSRFSGARFARLALPSAVVFLFCFALSLPGSTPWAVALLWFVAVSEEGAWWVADSLAIQTDRRRKRVSNSKTANDEVTDDDSRDVAARDVAARDVAARGGDVHFVPPSDVAGQLTQQMTRVRHEDGSDLIFGQARAEFVVGERSHAIHLAFCPPLTGVPRLTVMHAGGPAAKITVSQAEPFGARFDVRLAAVATQPASVMIEFEAHNPVAT